MWYNDSIGRYDCHIRRSITGGFENLLIADNFHQTSLFFPMPTVIIPLCPWTTAAVTARTSGSTESPA